MAFATAKVEVATPSGFGGDVITRNVTFTRVFDLMLIKTCIGSIEIKVSKVSRL